MTTDDARLELKNLQDIQNEINKTNGSWDDYDDNFKNNEKYLLDYARNNKVLEASTDDVKNANEKARQAAIANNNALQQQTLGAKATAIALKGLAIAGNALVMYAITELIKGLYNAATATSRLKEEAKSLGEELKNEHTEINNIKDRIDEYVRIAESDTSTVNERIEARKNLIAIQDELIKKYGAEEDAINNIQNAVKGSSDALYNLMRENYVKAIKEFNKNNDGFWDKIGRGSFDSASNYIGDMFENGIYKDIYSDLDYKPEDILNINKILGDAGYITNQAGLGTVISIKGDFSDVYTKLKNVEDYAYRTGLYTDDEIIKSIGKIISQYESYLELYNQGVLLNQITLDEKYKAAYEQMLGYKEDYDKAYLENDEEAMQKAINNMSELKEATSQKAKEEGKEGISDYFATNLFPELQNEFGKWKFDVNIQANVINLDNVKQEIDDLINNENISSDEIHTFDDKSYGDLTDTQKAVFDYINNLANQYGVAFDYMVDMLLSKSILQTDKQIEASNAFKNLFGQDKWDELTEEQKGIAYNIDPSTIKSWDELIAKIEEVKNTTKEPETWTKFTDSQIEAIDKYKSEVKTLGDTLTALSNGEDISETDLLKDFPELVGRTNDLSDAIRDLMESKLKALNDLLGEGLPDEAKLDLIEYTQALNGVAPALNTAFSSVQNTYKAFKDFEKEYESGKFTDSTLSSIAGINTSLNDLVAQFYAGAVSSKELFEALSNQYNVDLENYGRALIAKNAYSEEFYNATGMANTDLINKFYDDYNIDLKNCQTYNDAKFRIEQETIGKLGTIWSKYYNAQLMSTTAEYDKLVNDPDRRKDGGSGKFIGQLQAQKNAYEKALKGLNNIVYEGHRVDFDGIKSSFEASMATFDKNSSSSSSDSKETFDWIEKALSRVQRNITNLGKTVSATWKSWSNRNNALVSELAEVNKEIVLQQTAYDSYMNKANSISLSDYYKNLVKNGGLKIDEIADENLKKSINDFQTWYEKALACSDAINDLRGNLADLAKTKFTETFKAFDNSLIMVNHQKEMIDGYITQYEEAGYAASEVFYNALIEQQMQNVEILGKKYKESGALFDEAINNGSIEQYSDDWFEMIGNINDAEKALQDANTELIKYQKTLEQLRWDAFD